jgi:hypothetical protein
MQKGNSNKQKKEEIYSILNCKFFKAILTLNFVKNNPVPLEDILITNRVGMLLDLPMGSFIIRQQVTPPPMTRNVIEMVLTRAEKIICLQL